MYYLNGMLEYQKILIIAIIYKSLIWVFSYQMSHNLYLSGKLEYESDLNLDIFHTNIIFINNFFITCGPIIYIEMMNRYSPYI